MGNKSVKAFIITTIAALTLLVIVIIGSRHASAAECAPGNLLSHTQEIVKASPSDFSLDIITEPAQRDPLLKALADIVSDPLTGIDSLAVVSLIPDDKVIVGFVQGGCVQSYVMVPSIEAWNRFREKVLGQPV